MHKDTVTTSWVPLLCHSSATITSCFSMIMHSPMSQRSVHNSWKLKMSQFFHDLHTHQTPLSMFGMLWMTSMTACSSSRRYPATSHSRRNRRSGTTFHRPQSTAWSTLCEGDVLHCMRQIVVTPDTDWFSDPDPYLLFLRYLCPQSCEIYRFRPNEFISIDWFPYMNCNLGKIFEIVACCVSIFVQCISIIDRFRLDWTWMTCLWLQHI